MFGLFCVKMFEIEVVDLVVVLSFIYKKLYELWFGIRIEFLRVFEMVLKVFLFCRIM